jgi:REP-associated tyrosine transposase
MNRGDHQEVIFRGRKERELFLETLGQACEKSDWQVHAFYLMSNHFHLVVETPRGNLVEGMKWLLGTYTARYNRRHKFFGHLFCGRYKALPVDGSGTGYLKCACDYVHLNPARAGLLTRAQQLSAFPWSSYPLYLKPRAARPPWLRVDRLMGEHGIPRDSAAGRAAFERRMERRRAAEDGDAFLPLLRGWCVGGEDFRAELLGRMGERAGPEHYGPEIQEAGRAKVERLVRAELAKLGWAEADLARRRKGDPEKIRLAQHLRRETTTTLGWIAQRLCMGAKSHLSHLLYWAGRQHKPKAGARK